MIYLLALIVFALPSYLIKFSIFGIPTTMLEILIYIAAVYCIINYFFIKKQGLQDVIKFLSKYKSWLIPISLFVVAGIISIIISPDKRVALGLFKAYIIDPIILFFIIISIVKSKKDVDLLIKALIASGVVISLYAIYQKITGDYTFDGRILSFYKFWEGASANYLGLYLAPILVLITGYQIVNDKKIKFKQSIIYDIAFLICAIGLYLTGSRAAIGAVIVGLFILIVYRYWNYIKPKLWLKVVIFGLVFLGALFSYQVIKPDYTLSPEEGSRIITSNNIRWEIYKTTREILKSNYLLGVGIGNYQNYFTQLTSDRINYPEYIAPFALTPHNIFLNIWVNLGILGLIAFIWLLYLFFKECLKHNHLTTILAIVMITIIAYGLIDTPYWKNDLAIIWWLIIALAVVSKDIKNP